ncbi:Glutathione S-transferase 4 [Diplonema papillatum]|nr:Glutathione S-transferase 4 [Diplonema papillatum]
MPKLKIMYWGLAGKAEPTRLALTLGGIDFEDSYVAFEDWIAHLKAKVAPLQLPLLEVDEKTYSQSVAMCRYACKLAKVNGKPLYPEDAYEALLVDELTDKACEAFGPLMPTMMLKDEKEKEAARVALVVRGGPVEKWAVHADYVLAKSASGFACLGRLTMADLVIFATFGFFRDGSLDGCPTNCFDHLTHLKQHKDKISNIPKIKTYYANHKNPAMAFFKA